jgi:hypothetical protein
VGEMGLGRVRSRGAIVRSLRALTIRVHRFGVHRAGTAEERAWAGRLLEQLRDLVTEAECAATVQRSIEIAEQRAASARKSRTQVRPKV